MRKLIALFTMTLLALPFPGIFGQTALTAPDGIPIRPAPQNKQNDAGITSAEAFSDGGGVLLKWRTANEKNLLGFNIYRSNGKQSVLVNEHPVLSATLRHGPAFAREADYIFFDENGSLSDSYTFEAVYPAERKKLPGAVAPRYTPDLLNVSHISSAEFRQAKAAAEPVLEFSRLGIDVRRKSPTGTDQNLAETETQRWVAAQPGVKIGIKSEGIYRVTRAELEAAGFNVNSDPALWQLYLNGREQSMIVGDKGSYIEFYGAEVPDVPETDQQVYFLVVGPSPGKRINTTVGRRIGGSVEANNYLQIQTKKERRFYVGTLRNGDAQNFFGSFIGETPASIDFTLKGVDYTVPETEITIIVQGLSATPHNIRVVINETETGTFSGSNEESISHTFSVPTGLLLEGANNLKLSSIGNASDLSLFDTISVKLRRKYSADSDQLSFYTHNYKKSRVDGFSNPNIRVFDTTYDGSPSLITNFSVTESSGAFSVNIPSYRERRMYAVAAGAEKQAASIVPNTPSTLSQPTNAGQLIIITHKNWLAEADAWADYRRAGGFNVKVIDVEDVYDEFNFGNPSARSLTDFMQLAKTQWQTPPSYLLLLGDASYDPRNFMGVGYFNFVPTRFVSTVYSETGSDDAITDFDNDGLAEIPVGRIPARTPADVTQMLNKVTVFEQSVAQGFDRGALCVSDLPSGYDFAGLCTRVFNELPSTIEKTFLNRGDSNSSTVLRNLLNTGKYIVNYSGHGHATIWAANGFFNSTHALNLTNGDNLSIFTMLTCLNGYFVEPATPSLSENLLKAPNGGAVAAWSSSGLTTPDIQETMARRFYNRFGAGKMTRLGDLVNDSKTVLTAGRDVRLSWVLLGDPTLKVR